MNVMSRVELPFISTGKGRRVKWPVVVASDQLHNVKGSAKVVPMPILNQSDELCYFFKVCR